MRPDKYHKITVKGDYVQSEEKNITRVDAKDPNYLGKVIGAAVMADDNTHDIATSLAKLAMREATMILLYGTPQAKSQLLAKFLPYIAKSLNENAEDQTKSQLFEEFSKMKQEMFGEAEKVVENQDEAEVLDLKDAL